jgi:DnaJ-class molecular chaperone
MDAVRGGTLSVEYSLGGGARQHMDVRIPAGVRTGGTIRLRGRGAPGPGGGPAGDLLLKVEVEEHPLLRRTENDLEMDLPVTLEECLAGGVVDVPTVTGNVRVKVPAGCANGSRLRVTGRGVQAARGAGDLYLVVRPVLPGASEQAAKLARELDALRGADVRGAIVL